jgi:hypothetical protein
MRWCLQKIGMAKCTDTVNNSDFFASRLCADYGYELTIFPALATPEYPIYSGDKIPGGIGDNLASIIYLDTKLCIVRIEIGLSRNFSPPIISPRQPHCIIMQNHEIN